MNRKIYREIARKHGISVDEMKQEMQSAIDEAYKNPDSSLHSINNTGDIPSPNEVITYAVRRVQRDEKHTQSYGSHIDDMDIS